MAITFDFHQRLLLGEVEDYDDYKRQVLEQSVTFRPLILNKDLKNLIDSIQKDHWSTVYGKMAEPTPMLNLLL